MRYPFNASETISSNEKGFKQPHEVDGKLRDAHYSTSFPASSEQQNNDKEIAFLMHRQQQMKNRRQLNDISTSKAFFRSCLRLGDALLCKESLDDAAVAYNEVIDGCVNKNHISNVQSTKTSPYESEDSCRYIVAQAYHGMGLIQEKKNCLASAIESYNLSISRRCKSPQMLEEYGVSADDLDSANTLYRLGSCYKKSRKYEEALTHHLLSLNIRVQIYDEDHPLVVKCYKQVGILYHLIGHPAQASENNVKVNSWLEEERTSEFHFFAPAA